jgi:hypothetical protein
MIGIVIILISLVVLVQAYEQTGRMSAGKSKSQMHSVTVSKHKTATPVGNSLIQDFKDEIADCYDSLVNAMDNEERVQNGRAILYRHRYRLAAVGGTMLVAKALTRRRYISKKFN